MTDNTQLQEFNRLLVEVLLSPGKRGRSRLFLTTDHIDKLSQKRGSSKEAFIHELYEVVIAQDLCTGLEEQIKNYQAILSKLPGKIKNDGKIPINQSDFDQALNDLQVQITPPFFIYLVVIVHAYMSGEREDVDPIDVYETVTKNITKILEKTNPGISEQIHEKLTQHWHQVTRKRKYSLGSYLIDSGYCSSMLGEFSPWGILKRWSELRANSLEGGAIILDTCDVEFGPHGSVRPIRYNAPFLSEDRKVLVDIGKSLRARSKVKPSSSSMLRYIDDQKYHLSARARKTLERAFSEEDESAACFVDFINIGFESGESPTVSQSEKENITDVDSQNYARLEITINQGYYSDELEMSVRLVDTSAKDDDFIITIKDKKIIVPTNKYDKKYSEPIEEYHPKELSGLDLNSFDEYKLERGGNDLQMQKTSAFLRTLQARHGTWEEAEPSSKQKVLVVSNEEWASGYAVDERMKETKTMILKTIFKIDGRDIYGVMGIWPRQTTISTTTYFDLRSGIKDGKGRNRYLISAPPMVVHYGSRSHQEFVVKQVIDTRDVDDRERTLRLKDGGWTLEPVKGPSYVRVEHKEVPQWVSEQVFFVSESDRWRDFLRDNSYKEYRKGEMNFDHVKNIPDLIGWNSFKEKIQGVNESIKRARTKKEAETIQPFLISFEMAAHRQQLVSGKQLPPTKIDNDIVDCTKFGRVSIEDNCSCCYKRRECFDGT